MKLKTKRDLYAEIMEGFAALDKHRQGKRTLRTHKVTLNPVPKMSPAEVTQVRQNMHLSRPVFAGFLRINVRTLENWEQGRAAPNAQAVLLILLVKRFPDTVQRLAEI